MTTDNVNVTLKIFVNFLIFAFYVHSYLDNS